MLEKLTGYCLAQGLVQYDSAEPLIVEILQAPGSFAGAYKAAVIALTSVGACLMLLCLVMALATRHGAYRPTGMCTLTGL